MNKKEIQLEIKKLIKDLNYYKKQYYFYNNSEVEDSVYDQLYFRLLNLENDNPEFIYNNSPTQQLEGIKGGKKGNKRRLPMLSIDKCFFNEDLFKFINKIISKSGLDSVDFISEEKIDGLAFEVIYKNGIFYMATTRGDGYIGENISKNIIKLPNLPQNINFKGYLEIRGEIYIRKKNLNLVNSIREQNGFPKLKNCRNAASGIISQTKDNLNLIQYLSYFVYSIGVCSETIFYKENELLEFLQNLGFDTIEDYIISNDKKELLNYFNNKYKKRESMDYEIDGVVYKPNNRILQNSLGYNQTTYNYSIAYKFPALIGETCVKDIKFQIGRSGVLIPIAILKPVQIGTVIIEKALLYNFEYIKKIDIRIGDIVVLERSGDVIPKINKVLKDKRSKDVVEVSLPKHCFSCQTELVKKGKLYYCLNKLNCLSQLEQSLNHFVSKDCLNISSLGPQKIKQLIFLKIIESPIDIFRLEQKQNVLKNLNNWNNSSVLKLIKNINKSKKIELSAFIFSLNIPSLGKIKSKKLAQICENVFTFISYLKMDNIDFNKNIKDKLGEITYLNLKEFCQLKKNFIIIEELIEILDINSDVKEIYKGSICITGTFTTFKRTQIEEIAKNNNFKIMNKVTKDTDYLIKGNKPGNKLTAAINFNIKILDEKEFLKKFYF
jgi:DNA ligase (NAD+)